MRRTRTNRARAHFKGTTEKGQHHTEMCQSTEHVQQRPACPNSWSVAPSGGESAARHREASALMWRKQREITG